MSDLSESQTYYIIRHLPSCTGADPGFFLGGGPIVSCSTSTPINHIVFFFLQNTSCIRKPQVISRGGAHPLHPPPRSAPVVVIVLFVCVCYLVVLPFHAYLKRNSDINLVLTLQSQTFGHAELFQRF